MPSASRAARPVDSSSLHQLSDQALAAGARISRHSLYTDLVWQFDAGKGQRKHQASVSWNLVFLDGTRLTDPQHAQMLAWARRLVLTWLEVTIPGKSLRKESGIGTFAVGLRRLLEWMVHNGFSRPSDLTFSALECLKVDLQKLRRGGAWDWDISAPAADEENGDENDEEEVAGGEDMTWSPAFRVARAVWCLWEYRNVLARSGIEPIPAVPWDGLSAKEIAVRAGGSEPNWIQPLPDEVAVRLINAAVQMIGTCADDVMALQDEMYARYFAEPGKHWRGPGVSAGARVLRQRRAAVEFEFSTLEGAQAPWHPSLAKGDLDQGETASATRVLQLVKHVVAACGIVIQSMTGVRISEVCALQAGTHEGTGLPICVEKFESQSQVHEVFVLSGVMEKGEHVPSEERWLLGLRACGSTEIPIAVRALIVMDRALDYARGLAGRTDLFVSFDSGGGLPKTSGGVAEISSAYLNGLYRRFAAEFVCWEEIELRPPLFEGERPLEEWVATKGAVLRSHQFRKTFASYTLSENPQLLAAVKRQFRHMNMALTDQGYWGSGHAQVEPFDSITRQETALMIHQAMLGEGKLAGRMGAELQEEVISPLKAQVAGTPKGEFWRAAIAAADDIPVQVFHGRDGACVPLDITSMSCHNAANTRPLGRRLPNFSTRSTSMCSGCKCHVIALKHRGYWEERYVAHQESCEIARRNGIENGFERLRQSAHVAQVNVRRLGGDIAKLDAVVQARLALAGEVSGVKS